MGKHRFDPIALVIGVVFVAGGIIVLAGGRIVDEGRVLAPLALVGLGVALLLRPAHRPPPATSPAPVVPPGWGAAPPTATPAAGTPAAATPPAATPATGTPAAGTPAGGPADDRTDAVDGMADDGMDDVDAPDGYGGPEPDAPGRDFYLGSGWRPPQTPGDERPPEAPPA